MSGITLDSEQWHDVLGPGPLVLATVRTNSLSDPSTTSTIFYDSIWFI